MIGGKKIETEYAPSAINQSNQLIQLIAATTFMIMYNNRNVPVALTVSKGFIVALILLTQVSPTLAIDTSSTGPPTLAGCQVFPADNIWNVPINTLPVDTNSYAYVNTIGASDTVHADFGSGEWPPSSGAPIGIPYVDVPETHSGVTVTFDYHDESDHALYPIPPDAPIEGGINSEGDRHILVLERGSCTLYELFDAYLQPDSSWHAGSGAIFDLNTNALRPAFWTSADAAGLPILPGLVRFNEVAAGAINHALRFTAPQTRKDYVWPARHYASTLTDTQFPPMGQRFRLKANYVITGFSAETRTILQALKVYGMFLADNGSAWYISGVPDERWDNDVIHQLHQVDGNAFEAVDVSSLMVDPDSGQASISQTLQIYLFLPMILTWSISTQ